MSWIKRVVFGSLYFFLVSSSVIPYAFSADADQVIAKVGDLDSRIAKIEKTQAELSAKMQEISDKLDHLKILVRRF